MYRTRGYLPHIEVPESTYFITFRLVDTLPQELLNVLEEEKNQLLQVAIKRTRSLFLAEEKRLKYLQSKKIQDFLDRGIGNCWLKKKEIAEIVAGSLLYFENIRYTSHAWCVMPNHVHWVMTPLSFANAVSSSSTLAKIIHSIKSYSAHQANKKLNRSGSFWHREYYDHRIKTSEEFSKLIAYTLANPVKIGLCQLWWDWPWTKCSENIVKQFK